MPEGIGYGPEAKEQLRNLQQAIGASPLPVNDPTFLGEIMAGGAAAESDLRNPEQSLQAGIKMDTDAETSMQIMEAFKNMPPEMQQKVLQVANEMMRDYVGEGDLDVKEGILEQMGETP